MNHLVSARVSLITITGEHILAHMNPESKRGRNHKEEAGLPEEYGDDLFLPAKDPPPHSFYLHIYVPCMGNGAKYSCRRPSDPLQTPRE